MFPSTEGAKIPKHAYNHRYLLFSLPSSIHHITINRIPQYLLASLYGVGSALQEGVAHGGWTSRVPCGGCAVGRCGVAFTAAGKAVKEVKAMMAQED